MSGIAIASMAAAGAAVVLLERWKIRRDAMRRALSRRIRASCRWAPLVATGAVDPLQLRAAPSSPFLSEDKLSVGLARSLEHAVRAGDEVSSYEARLFGGRTGESPFRMRRARVNGAERRFAAALARVRTRSQTWLEQSAVGDGAVVRHAIARVADTVEQPGSSGLTSVDAMIDVLENALANLYRPATSATLHPFR